MRKIIILCFICCFMTACAVPTKEHLPTSASNGPQKLLIFMDGTANDETSYTNVNKLYDLVTLQNRTDIKAAYITGVGTGFRLLGMTLGTGLDNDIKQAYSFLTTHHQSPEDKIYLFGFSRGAYGARALAGLIQTAGIPDFSNLTTKERKRSVRMIFDAYYGQGTVADRRERIRDAKIPFYDKNKVKAPAEIEFVGIWDTVAALTLPDFTENNLLENQKYIDQLCYAKRIYHALSLDDDRATIFTPVLINNHARKAQCKAELLKVKTKLNERSLNQVFFSGAHSDVGGGYDDTTIDGVSLNWILDKLDDDGLLPNKTRVDADPYDLTHDPEEDLKLFRFNHRQLSKYAALLDDGFWVHQSAIDRLKHVYQQCHETDWQDQENVLRHCFKSDQQGGFDFTPGDQCLIKVDNSGYETPPKPVELKDAKGSCETDDAVLPCTKAINIDPRDKNNKTTFEVNPEHRYRFSIKTKYWKDGNNCATPEVGRRISRGNSSRLIKFFSYPFKLLTYDVRAGYTELIGHIEGDQQKWKTIRIGRLIRNKEIYQPHLAGRLIIRANDPQVGDEFYCNNGDDDHGKEDYATLYITRVR